ncbi:MAG: DUF6484 domain-containing protein [Limnobaculum xujianqingii]
MSTPERKLEELSGEPESRDEQLMDNAALLDDILKRSMPIGHVNPHRLPAIVLGQIVDINNDEVFILVNDVFVTPVKALTICPVSLSEVGRTCVVQFIQGDIEQPIVMGLLVNTLHEQKPSVTDVSTQGLTIEQQDQGIVIESKRDITLKCGESQIVMTADGMVQIRALYIDTHAQATHRLKGGSIQVN